MLSSSQDPRQEDQSHKTSSSLFFLRWKQTFSVYQASKLAHSIIRKAINLHRQDKNLTEKQRDEWLLLILEKKNELLNILSAIENLSAKYKKAYKKWLQKQLEQLKELNDSQPDISQLKLNHQYVDLLKNNNLWSYSRNDVSNKNSFSRDLKKTIESIENEIDFLNRSHGSGDNSRSFQKILQKKKELFKAIEELNDVEKVVLSSRKFIKKKPHKEGRKESVLGSKFTLPVNNNLKHILSKHERQQLKSYLIRLVVSEQKKIPFEQVDLEHDIPDIDPKSASFDQDKVTLANINDFLHSYTAIYGYKYKKTDTESNTQSSILQKNNREYKILKQPIGEGESKTSKVIKGLDLTSNKEVAIKKMFPKQDHDLHITNLLSGFKEYQICESYLKDVDNIMHFQDIILASKIKNSDTHQIYLIMPVFKGGSAEALTQTQIHTSAKNTEIFLPIAKIIAQTMSELHQRLVFHRDLKPDNILFDEQGKPHIIDFGAAIRFNLKPDGSYDTFEVNNFLDTKYLQPLTAFDNEIQSMEMLDSWRLGLTLLQLLDAEIATTLKETILNTLLYKKDARYIADNPYINHGFQNHLVNIKKQLVNKGYNLDLINLIFKLVEVDFRKRMTAIEFSEELNKFIGQFNNPHKNDSPYGSIPSEPLPVSQNPHVSNTASTETVQINPTEEAHEITSSIDTTQNTINECPEDTGNTTDYRVVTAVPSGMNQFVMVEEKPIEQTDSAKYVGSFPKHINVQFEKNFLRFYSFTQIFYSTSLYDIIFYYESSLDKQKELKNFLRYAELSKDSNKIDPSEILQAQKALNIIEKFQYKILNKIQNSSKIMNIQSVFNRISRLLQEIEEKINSLLTPYKNEKMIPSEVEIQELYTALAKLKTENNDFKSSIQELLRQYNHKRKQKNLLELQSIENILTQMDAKQFDEKIKDTSTKIDILLNISIATSIEENTQKKLQKQKTLEEAELVQNKTYASIPTIMASLNPNPLFNSSASDKNVIPLPTTKSKSSQADLVLKPVEGAVTDIVPAPTPDLQDFDEKTELVEAKTRLHYFYQKANNVETISYNRNQSNYENLKNPDGTSTIDINKLELQFAIQVCVKHYKHLAYSKKKIEVSGKNPALVKQAIITLLAMGLEPVYENTKQSCQLEPGDSVKVNVCRENLIKDKLIPDIPTASYSHTFLA